MGMRAMPNRSVASVLRQDADVPALIASRPDTEAEAPTKPGVLGREDMRRPQDRSVQAEVMRAMPNRSVASVLRQDANVPALIASRPDTEAEAPTKPGVLGREDMRRPLDRSVAAEVKRAMPNRSVAS